MQIPLHAKSSTRIQSKLYNHFHFNLLDAHLKRRQSSITPSSLLPLMAAVASPYPTKPKRRKQRETTISISAYSSPSSSPPNFSPTYSPTNTTMDPAAATYSHYPSSYTKFNSALNAGLLNPMSPPPFDKTRSSPTLFDMMANEHDYQPRAANPNPNPLSHTQDRQLLLQERLAEILAGCSPNNQFNDETSSDVRLTLTSKDGLSVSLNVHRHVLIGSSRFFGDKLSDRWSKQQRSLPHLIEISDCDDVEIYLEVLRLMYCKDLRRKLMREDVSRVLGILKVAAAIHFDVGVLACLEYLEAVPWAEDEEEKVASLLSELNLECPGAAEEVLKRVSIEFAQRECEASNGLSKNEEEILGRLLQVVLEGKDEKARREMKGLVSKMLRENNGRDISKESLYSASNGCLQLLQYHFIKASSGDTTEASQISRQADNLHWILDILIDRQIADELLRTWASQSELSALHTKVAPMLRYEISRVTARLFVGIGKGQILVSKEARCLLLKTWLEPFYEDFGWMRRACKGLDRHSIEDGLGSTILTLPMAMQQEILMAWFDRFLNCGEDCPNIQRGFEVWWRRAFWKRNGEDERKVQLRIAAVCENSR